MACQLNLKEQKILTKENNPMTKFKPAKSVLVIDDDPIQCSLIETVLSKEGYEVHCCLNGEEGLEFMKNDSSDLYDLIVLDLILPGIGGYFILQKMQEDNYQKVPVIVISSKSMDSSTVNFIKEQNNVKQFYPKPIDFNAFKKEILSLTENLNAASHAA